MKRDKAYLQHMLEAISDIEKFIEDVTEEDFHRNKRSNMPS